MTEPEAWPENDPDTFLGDCGRCGETRPLQLVTDPFGTESVVEGMPAAPVAWCFRCFHDRADELTDDDEIAPLA